ncbi:MAG: glycerol-3-phosphate acyltransferase [Alphaproteobacteria bacterium]|nr:glycerol-3-phosphate acyltransferase [Alphaproteobacteria bacterium]
MSEDASISFAIVLGYLLGSIPFGLLLPRIAGFGDIRAIGSGNIGATNVLRTGSKKLALAVLLLDGGKGALAVAIAATQGGHELYFAAGISAVFGHLFPIWLRRDRRALITLALLAFGLSTALAQSSIPPIIGVVLLLALAVTAWGGKGVATTLGVLLAALPLVGALTALTWLAAALVTKRSSAGALIALVAAPLYCLALPLMINPTLQPFDYERAAFALFLSLVVTLRHHDNIRRLMRGEEPRIKLSGGARP